MGLATRPSVRHWPRADVPSPRSRRGWPLRLLLVLCVLSACSGGETVAEPTPTPPPRAVDPLRETARREGTVTVIVQLAVPTNSRGAIVRAQRELLDDLGRGARVVARYGRLPQIALRVTPRALRALRSSPLVVNITVDEAGEATE